MKIRFRVEFELPEYATPEQAEAYVFDAVAGMKGCYHPTDPMFELDDDSVVVRTLGKKRA